MRTYGRAVAVQGRPRHVHWAQLQIAVASEDVAPATSVGELEALGVKRHRCNAAQITGTVR